MLCDEIAKTFETLFRPQIPRKTTHIQHAHGYASNTPPRRGNTARPITQNEERHSYARSWPSTHPTSNNSCNNLWITTSRSQEVCAVAGTRKWPLPTNRWRFGDRADSSLLGRILALRTHATYFVCTASTTRFRGRKQKDATTIIVWRYRVCSCQSMLEMGRH